jgi:hypothetical protein
MGAAYNPDQWRTFASGLTTASGALAGLVFVAMLSSADGAPRAVSRAAAESAFFILLAVLALSVLSLSPGQGRVAVGVESTVVGGGLEFRAVRTRAILRAFRRRERGRAGRSRCSGIC